MNTTTLAITESYKKFTILKLQDKLSNYSTSMIMLQRFDIREYREEVAKSVQSLQQAAAIGDQLTRMYCVSSGLHQGPVTKPVRVEHTIVANHFSLL